MIDHVECRRDLVGVGHVDLSRHEAQAGMFVGEPAEAVGIGVDRDDRAPVTRQCRRCGVGSPRDCMQFGMNDARRRRSLADSCPGLHTVCRSAAAVGAAPTRGRPAGAEVARGCQARLRRGDRAVDVPPDVRRPRPRRRAGHGHRDPRRLVDRVRARSRRAPSTRCADSRCTAARSGSSTPCCASWARPAPAGREAASSSSPSTASRAARWGSPRSGSRRSLTGRSPTCFTPVERCVLAYTDALVYDGGRVADGVFDELRRHLSDEEILELTYITTMYEMHAVMSRRCASSGMTAPSRTSRSPRQRAQRRETSALTSPVPNA